MEITIWNAFICEACYIWGAFVNATEEHIHFQGIVLYFGEILLQEHLPNVAKKKTCLLLPRADCHPATFKLIINLVCYFGVFGYS